MLGAKTHNAVSQIMKPFHITNYLNEDGWVSSGIGYMKRRRNAYYIFITYPSSVTIVTGYELDGQGSIPGRGTKFLSIP
jgi:hypothetical protein